MRVTATMNKALLAAGIWGWSTAMDTGLRRKRTLYHVPKIAMPQAERDDLQIEDSLFRLLEEDTLLSFSMSLSLPGVSPTPSPVVKPTGTTAPNVSPSPHASSAPIATPTPNATPVVPTPTTPTVSTPTTPTVSTPTAPTVPTPTAPTVPTPTAPTVPTPTTPTVPSMPSSKPVASPSTSVPNVPSAVPGGTSGPATTMPSPTSPTVPSGVPGTPSPTLATIGTTAPNAPSVEPGSAAPIAGQSPVPTLVATPAPSSSAAASDRDAEILAKCGTTAEERSSSILSILATVSNITLLLDSTTPQYEARDWIDNIDAAILCPSNPARITQRYTAALLYFDLNGPNWTNCQADLTTGSSLGGCVYVDDNGTSTPAVRFLDVSNECDWFGLACYAAPDYQTISADDQYPLSVIDLPDNGLAGDLAVEVFSLTELVVFTMDGNGLISGTIPTEIAMLTKLEYLDIDKNNLVGTIPEEIFSLTKLKVLDMDTNNFTGTLSSSVGNLLDLSVLQLENNRLAGPVPTDALIRLEQMVALTLENNDLTGSVEAICDVEDERRANNYTIYLRFFHVDCLGTPPQIECSCCRCF